MGPGAGAPFACLPFTPHPDDWFAEYVEPAVHAMLERPRVSPFPIAWVTTDYAFGKDARPLPIRGDRRRQSSIAPAQAM
ncbi:hypothetical protein Spla01_01297 [Streptomyces platensis]|uniref:Uncharacterized protein n=1 Tax=Streptomyces platensis TaxID=58346 RepID=A0ABX3XM93_STRPT|nr:hypothetical protein BG653_06710 [Streptomyces platensis]